MLNYRVDIRTWQQAPENRQFHGLEVRQTLVYLGPGSWKPNTEIEEPNFRFSYNFVDAKSLDPDPLLESENLGDVTLALLCRDGQRPDVIRRIVKRIAAAPASEQPDALTKLSVLSDLREIGPRVQSEIEKMGLPVNLEESTLLRGTFDRVRAETSVDAILEVLEARFPGTLPADLKQRLNDLGRDELKDALRRSATAGSSKRPWRSEAVLRTLRTITQSRDYAAD